MANSSFYKAIIIPSVVMQSVAVAGGYGTGREVVEYFTVHGALGGLLGLLTVMLVLGTTTGLTFEYARRFQLYDYRSFFKHLIGRFWVAFECLYIAFFLLVLAIIASASGQMLNESLGLPQSIGLMLILVSVGVLSYYGRDTIAQIMVVWTLVIFAVFIVYFDISVFNDFESVTDAFATDSIDFAWLFPALKFALYSSTVIPVILFSARGIRTKPQAFTAGYCAVILSMLPGVLFHLSFLTARPDVLEQSIPVYWMINIKLGAVILLNVYIVAMFGTFIETGAGFIEALNERIDAWSLERTNKPVRRLLRSVVAIVALLLSAALAQIGIIKLIAEGFGSIALGFLIVYIIPLYSLGIFQMKKSSKPNI